MVWLTIYQEQASKQTTQRKYGNINKLLMNKQEIKHSGKKLQFFDHQENKSYVPYVVETSIGLDRMFLAILSAAFTEETLEDGSERLVLRIPPALAPAKVAVLPLLKKDGLPEKAREIIDELKFDFTVQYDEKDAIGRRYRRHQSFRS